jgi:hypothetical protein
MGEEPQPQVTRTMIVRKSLCAGFMGFIASP